MTWKDIVGERLSIRKIDVKIKFVITFWVPEVGNTADTPIPLGYYPLRGNLGVPTNNI